MDIDLLLEKYLNSAKLYDGNTYDIFINPSKKELKEIGDSSYRGTGFRFIIDFKKKNVYAFSTEMIHRWALESFDYWDDLYYIPYFDKGLGSDRYFFGHVIGNQVLSDIWSGYEYRIRNLHQDIPIEKIQKMKSYDKSWIKKYGIEPRKLEWIIDAVLDAYIEEK